MNDKSEEEIPVQSNYFDRRAEEEDEPVTVSEENQIKCEILDDMYDNFFEDDFLNIAKVINICKFFLAKFEIRKRHKKTW